MRQITLLASVFTLFAAACADDELIPPPAIDAAIDAADIDTATIDASTDDADLDGRPGDARPDAASSVSVVQCPGMPDLEISAATGAYVPQSSTISVNDVVQFTPGDPNHDMVSGANNIPDGRFSTITGQVTCLRFTAAGTFPFYCSVHAFTGTITVN